MNAIFLGRRVLPFAFSNPIYVDADEDERDNNTVIADCTVRGKIDIDGSLTVDTEEGTRGVFIPGTERDPRPARPRPRPSRNVAHCAWQADRTNGCPRAEDRLCV